MTIALTQAAAHPSDPSAPCDAELLARTRAGDNRAFAELYERLEPAARRYARRLVSPSDVDDVVAESFANILRAIQSGSGPVDHAVKYLMVTVRTTAGHIHRRRAQELDKGMRLEVVTASDDDRVRFEDRALMAAFRSLSERRRTVIWLSEFEGLSAAEVGERLGLSPNAASALCYRARRALRDAYLQASGGESSPLTVIGR